MRRLIPDTIAARTLLVLIVGLTVSHVLSVALYLTDQVSASLFTGGEHTGERIATIMRLVEDASQAERQRIVELADYPRFHVTWSQESAVDDQQSGGWQVSVLRNALAAHLDGETGLPFKLRHSDQGPTEMWQTHMNQNHRGYEPNETLMVSLHLSDGSWLNFAVPVEAPAPFWSLRFALSMLVMLLAVVVLSALVVRHLTRPLGTFARASQRLGTDVEAPSLPESGPLEVRHAVRAFNEMQGRIRRFVDDRTEMLVAISHDLGTPITRLRLRAEFVEDQEQRRKMLADLDDMEKMVFSALSFAREEAASEPRAKVDLRTLLQRVCDDLADSENDVVLAATGESVSYECQPVAMRRALTNLVENAVRYGQRAHVTLDSQQSGVLIGIDDEGAGIPEELHEDVFKPFRRLEISRSPETGGTGLGLTVARTIIRAHGGEVTLRNKREGGLRVEVSLPR